MESITEIILSFIAGMAFMRFSSWIIDLGYSTIMMKRSIKDCLTVLASSIQANIEAHEIKYNALEIAERPDKYIEFQKKVDKGQLVVLQKTIIRNFIASIPPKYNHLIHFDDWNSAMVYLDKQFKRSQR
jgi:hypothetical protein